MFRTRQDVINKKVAEASAEAAVENKQVIISETIKEVASAIDMVRVALRDNPELLTGVGRLLSDYMSVFTLAVNQTIDEVAIARAETVANLKQEYGLSEESAVKLVCGR